MYKLDAKRAVITGAASGLGRSLALALAREGWRIGIVDINDAGAAGTLDMVERAGGSGEVFHADVADPEEVAAMASYFFDRWGGVDLFINNAGVASVGFVGDIPLEDWKWVFEANFWGMVYGCHEFVPRMKRQGGGHIVNVASSAGLLASPEMGPYNTTKAAVVSLSETLRAEVSPHNIGITVACPMFFKTNLVDTARYSDEWEYKFFNCTFDNARMDADEVAKRIIAAVKKDRLYVVPQLPGKILWLNKRLTPAVFHDLFRFLNRHGMLRPLMYALARLGLLQ
ncbi:MAG: SDR family NAD(P)-dependent oxidoreductase [Actinomycetota bacterium]